MNTPTVGEIKNAPGADRRASSDGQLRLLLAFFEGHKTAAKARGGLDDQLRAQGDELLETVVLRVDEKRKTTTHDPRVFPSFPSVRPGRIQRA